MKPTIPLFILLKALISSNVAAQKSADFAYPKILSMQERAAIEDEWLNQRLNTIIPRIMRQNNVDMWVLISREYNEDPVLSTMLPATWFASRRRTVLVFHDRGSENGGVERFAISRYALKGIGGEDLFPAKWDSEEEPNQWKRLADLVKERDPKTIAVNSSKTFALADGISHSQYSEFMASLPDQYKARVSNHDALAISWLETRIPSEMERYGNIVQIAHAIIAEGLSEKVIIPGKTTASDVSWWYRDKIRSLKLQTWFHPSVSIQRAKSLSGDQKFTELFSGTNQNTLQKGDLIHVDFGITYLGLNTDTQQHAYILRDGETDTPAGLKNALRKGNQLQDILVSFFKSGRSGNEALKLARQKALAEGINPSIYTHPIGYHGHAAGATIGLWDQQGGVKDRGDYPINDNTAWSIELSTLQKIPEWNDQEIRIMLEEDGFFSGSDFYYLNGRQKAFHLIPRQSNNY
ncbi:M24 family metallopeptidase [Kordiimonas sp. SCSIO 12610]|uniref:M24 family metallopeptidase n=1 Tax=Kordiimonas sp. SCSIO 12610 TaxID=2829597 RepID=UPI00210C97C3|nr:M24 family metallopeptidase [Kordiimonas sp. SCSIO 12610]UTW54871.1 M24 family metallopeptidase [Kordiimonas sp. SCSIO 12610]